MSQSRDVVTTELTIELDWSDEPRPVYANGAQVAASPREFALLLTDFAAFAGRGGVALDQVPKAKIVANVRLTPDAFFRLASACASNWNLFVNQMGDPSVRHPKFKLMGADKQLEGIGPR